MPKNNDSRGGKKTKVAKRKHRMNNSGKFKGYIVEMKNHSKYVSRMDVSPRGIQHFIGGKKLNLDMAPTDSRGNIGLVEVKSNGILYVDGTPYLDVANWEYFPEEKEHDNNEISKKHVGDNDDDDDDHGKNTKGNGRVFMKNSIGRVETGTTVNIF